MKQTRSLIPLEQARREAIKRSLQHEGGLGVHVIALEGGYATTTEGYRYPPEQRIERYRQGQRILEL